MHKSSFSVKLSILMVLIVCLPLSIVTIQAYMRIRTITLQNNREMTQNNLASMANNINVYFDQYHRITDLLFISEDLQQLARELPTDRVEIYKANRQFENAVTGITFNSPDLDNVYLFTANGCEYFLQSNLNLPLVKSCCEEYLAEDPNPEISNLFVTGFFTEGKNASPQYKILFLRPLFNYVSREYLGMLALEFSSGTLSKLLGYSSDITLVVSPKDVILYNSTGSCPGEKVSDYFDLSDSPNDYENIEIEGKSYVYTSIDTQYSWKIIYLTDSYLSTQLIISAIGPVLFVTLLCIAVFLMIAISMTGRMVSPVKQLETLTKKVSEGDLSVRADIHTGDEFQVLAESYNHMLDQLNQIIERACNAEGMRIDAEYRALQSQINPHFLYNALETINSLAQINSQSEISQMICALADMFRYSTHQSAKLVTVREELSYLHNYMYLQSFGYEDKIHITYDIPDELLNLHIPKVILQPLVENCLNHGFDASSLSYHISVSGHLTGDVLTFTIVDDGIGMTVKQLTAIQQKLASAGDSQPDKSSIGLTNIHKRLQFLFGEDSGLSITSAYHQGTSVLMKIHLREETTRELPAAGKEKSDV